MVIFNLGRWPLTKYAKVPDPSATVRYHQSLIASGGSAPMRTSLIMPPASPVTSERASTPMKSSFSRIARLHR